MATKKLRFISLLAVSISLIVFPLISLITPPRAYAATSPALGTAGSFSVLGGATVTNTGITTTNGAVGVSPGSAVTDTGTLTAGGGILKNDASAIAAQADNLTAFGSLNQDCTVNYADGQDLTLLSPLGPGVYCSAGSFLLTKDLTLTGSGVWIFKTVSTLITSTGSSVTGGDPCNVWWMIGSSATIETTTSFMGNILSYLDISIKNGASLNGRALAQAGGAVTMDSNTISGPICTAAAAETTTSTSTTTSSSTEAPVYVCPTIPIGIVTPAIIDAKRIDANSIFLSWGPYSGTDKFIVRYGPTDGNWLYNTDVTGFSTTINALPANQPIWIQVAARNECQVGTYSASKQIGGIISVSRVLGASTDTLAATGSFDQFIRIIIAATATLSVFLLGKALLRVNEVS